MTEHRHGLPHIPPQDPMALHSASRHPFQLWTMVACIIGGGGNLVSSTSVITQILPRYIITIWAFSLMISGALALSGAFWPDRIFGLLLERTGLTTLGTAGLAYGAAILLVAGHAGVVGGPLTMSVGIASFWRVYYVNRELRVLQRFISRTHLHEE